MNGEIYSLKAQQIELSLKLIITKKHTKKNNNKKNKTIVWYGVDIMFKNINPSPAEPGYALTLQTV